MVVFVQDSQEGSADDFDFMLDSDKEGSGDAFLLDAIDDEVVPKMEPQELGGVEEASPSIPYSGAASGNHSAMNTSSTEMSSMNQCKGASILCTARKEEKPIDKEEGGAKCFGVDVGGYSQEDDSKDFEFEMPQSLGFFDDTSTGTPCSRHFFALCYTCWTVRRLTLNLSATRVVLFFPSLQRVTCCQR